MPLGIAPPSERLASVNTAGSSQSAVSAIAMANAPHRQPLEIRAGAAAAANGHRLASARAKSPAPITSPATRTGTESSSGAK